jgi:hypothetical protein
MSTNQISIALGSLQLAALECHADQDALDSLAFETVGEAVRLVFDAEDGARVAELVNDASNSADAQHQDGRGEKVDQRMAATLADLAVRIGRRARAAVAA